MLKEMKKFFSFNYLKILLCVYMLDWYAMCLQMSSQAG